LGILKIKYTIEIMKAYIKNVPKIAKKFSKIIKKFPTKITPKKWKYFPEKEISSANK
jgi:mRNA-degrading endonuclease RelE of RelBE toxin-antitoxin system